MKLVGIGRNATALFGSGSRIFALGSQFLIVIVLTRLFSKAEFGNFMVAFAAYRVLATGVGTGLASVLLYHVSRVDDGGGTEVRLHRAALLVGLVTGVAICATVWFAADPIAIAIAKPDMAQWLRAMMPFLLCTLLSTVTTGSYEGRSQVAMAIFLTEVAPNFLRLVLLGALPFTGLPTIWVAHVMAFSVLLPWLFSIRHLCGGVPGMQAFSRWDYGYAAKLTLYNFAAMQVQGVDMIVAGWLFPAESVADYAVASRIAALFPFFLQLRVRMFGPIAGKLLARGDKAELQKEVLVAKDFASIMVALTVAGMLIASPIFLKLFWGSGSIGLLLVLSAFPPVYRALFAAGDRLLQVAGHADWNVGIMLTALTIVVGVPFLLGGRIGIISLPIAMIISGFLLNPVISYAVMRTTGITLLRRSDVLVVIAAALCTLGPILFAHGAWLMFSAGGLFLLLALVQVWQHRDALRKPA